MPDRCRIPTIDHRGKQPLLERVHRPAIQHCIAGRPCRGVFNASDFDECFPDLCMSLSQRRQQMEFYPASTPAPEEKRTNRLLLRPLQATDVELDYDAVMSSAEQVRRRSQSDWPADDFTLAQNLDDLQRHEREHRERVAFT